MVVGDEIKRAKSLAAQQAQIAADARDFLAKTAAAAKPLDDAYTLLGNRYAAVVAALNASLPRMDDVISRSTASGADLRAMIPDVGTTMIPMPPYRSGTEYAIQGVERELVRLTEIAASMADNTRSNAELAKASVQQSIALLAALDGLHATTREGVAGEERREVAASKRDRVNSRLSWAIFFLTGVLVVLTAVLVQQAG